MLVPKDEYLEVVRNLAGTSRSRWRSKHVETAEAFRRGMKFADDQAYLKNEAEFKRGYDQGKVDGRDEGVCEATADATAAYERRASRPIPAPSNGVA